MVVPIKVTRHRGSCDSSQYLTQLREGSKPYSESLKERNKCEGRVPLSPVIGKVQDQDGLNDQEKNPSHDANNRVCGEERRRHKETRGSEAQEDNCFQWPPAAQKNDEVNKTKEEEETKVDKDAPVVKFGAIPLAGGDSNGEET